MPFEFDIPQEEKSIIKVIGVGGGGSNAVSHMYRMGIVGVDFAISNTDSQSMETSPVLTKIHLGPECTEGRGAGSKPAVGKQACIESIEDIRRFLDENTKMLFITAGMGGGTGTGAAPIIAQAARDMGILTVGIVTVPFTFEGNKRAASAHQGIEEIKKHVDALIVVSNDKLRQIYGNLSLTDAFGMADDILATAAKGIAEIITIPGYVNVDFEDVNTVMRESGVAIMGTAIGDGENRAKMAVEGALSSQLLEENDIRGARHILLNITSGSKEVTMDEVGEINEYVQSEAGYDTTIIWGNCTDEALGDKICVTVIATGFDGKDARRFEENTDLEFVPLDAEIAAELPFTEAVEAPVIKAKTVDFGNIQESVEKINKVEHSYADPYVKHEDQERMRKEKAERMQEVSIKRKLESTPVSTLTKEKLYELEQEPAYERYGIELDEIPNSAKQGMSRYSISEDESSTLKYENTFLFDNVD